MCFYGVVYLIEGQKKRLVFNKYIMDVIILTSLKEKQPRKVNTCRIFLNIIPLSDMCHPNRVDIYHQFFFDEKNSSINHDLAYPT